MPNTSSRASRWLRFSIGNLLVLILGIALGFLPLRLWELRQSPEPQVLVHLQVVEVPRDSLPSLGLDPAELRNSSLATLSDSDALTASLDTLRQVNKAKLLAEPTLVTVTGRPASFNVGGEIPVPVISKDGRTSVEFHEYGTRVDLLPTLLRNGRIRLAISPQISVIDNTRSTNIAEFSVPAVRTRAIEAEIEMADGETVVLGGFAEQSPPTATTRETLVVAKVERVQSR